MTPALSSIQYFPLNLLSKAGPSLATGGIVYDCRGTRGGRITLIVPPQFKLRKLSLRGMFCLLKRGSTQK